jgi:hypothetical protein
MTNDKQRKQRKRVAVLLAVGLGIELLSLGYVGYTLWGEMREQAALATASSAPTPVPVELWDAYEKAHAVARAQAEDAQLVSASTQWQTVSEQTLLDGASNWSFVFYSPTSKSSLDIVANAKEAHVVNQTRIWVASSPLPGGAWQEGPREALLVFLAYGGRAFLAEHPDAMVDLHLADSGANGNAEGAAWTIVALNPEDQSLFPSQIDAATNQVLSD